MRTRKKQPVVEQPKKEDDRKQPGKIWSSCVGGSQSHIALVQSGLSEIPTDCLITRPEIGRPACLRQIYWLIESSALVRELLMSIADYEHIRGILSSASIKWEQITTTNETEQKLVKEIRRLFGYDCVAAKDSDSDNDREEFEDSPEEQDTIF
jgi:hypothetical protein